MVRSRSDGTEPPSPPRSPTTFLFTFQSSDLVLFGGVLLEALGGSSIQRVLSILSTRLGRSRGCRDLLRQRMFEPLPHPNRLEYSIRPLSGSLGWEQGSKPFVVLDIDCCGWS
uniref:Uncharacterized protein n=1 Tax=Fagus sylvatica TaxID=28930 RepID=A0A2N9FI19_FAGSY